MGVFDLYKPVKSISPDEVRKHIENSRPQTYCLLDVRQPGEYEGGHLPGAKLIPLAELSSKISEINGDRSVIVYCRSGNRSLSAASMLIGAGFKDVLNMDGGIMAFNGIVASGGPEAGMFCFPATMSPAELVAMAWFLEDGTLKFINEIKEKCDSCNEPSLLNELTADKEGHKKSLALLYTEITGEGPGEDFPGNAFELPSNDVMVGCAKTSEAIKWAMGKKPLDILEFMMSLEANALDLYLKLARMSDSDEARKIFMKLADDEITSIKRIAGIFEKLI